MSRTIARRAQELLPSGSLTATAFPPERMVLARGQGSRVWDTDGNEYIDYLLGSGPLLVGHAHPAVVEAVQRRAALGSTFYALNEPVLELAELMVERIPCAEAVQFCTSGSEATGYALRIARAATGRDTVLKFEGGFHGAHDYSVMSLFPQGPPRVPLPEPSSAGVPRSLESNVLVAPYNDLDATAAIVEQHADSLAAVIVEPVQRAIDMVDGFLPGLRELTSRHEMLLVFDEVVTGFRVASGGAQELYGVKPDLACYGKVLGGGYPLAAIAGPRALLDLTAAGRTPADGFVYINGTLNGNPVSAAAGIATLRLLDADAYARLAIIGERLRGGILRLLLDAGLPGQVQGVGPMYSLFVTNTPVRDYRSARTSNGANTNAISSGAILRGVFLPGAKGYASLVHSDSDIEETLAALAEAIAGAVR